MPLSPTALKRALQAAQGSSEEPPVWLAEFLRDGIQAYLSDEAVHKIVYEHWYGSIPFRVSDSVVVSVLRAIGGR